MSTLLRFAGSAALVSTLVVSAFAVGCSVEGADEEGAQSSDINGSLGNAQACAVRDAYLRATVADFKTLQATELPFAFSLPSNGTRPLYSQFQVAGLGTVYYVEYTYNADGGSTILGSFFDASGRNLVRSASSVSASIFYSPAGGTLVCGGSTTSSSGSTSGWSSSSGSTSGWGSSSGCYGAGCVPEGGASSSSSSGWGSSSGLADAGFGHD